MEALREKEADNREVVSLIRHAQEVANLQVTIPSTSLVREKRALLDGSSREEFEEETIEDFHFSLI